MTSYFDIKTPDKTPNIATIGIEIFSKFCVLVCFFIIFS